MINMVFEEGVEGLFKLTDTEYFASEGLSNSKMGLLLQSMNHYLKGFGSPTKKMELGSLVHLKLLEPDKFDRSVVVADLKKPRSNARADNPDKIAYDEFMEAHVGKQIIDMKTSETIEQMVDSVMSRKKSREILEFTEREIASYKKINGVFCKGKCDIFAPEMYVADLKSTADASDRGFARSVEKYSYFRQAALYCDLFGVNEYWIIAVENEAPFNTNEFLLTEQYLNAGRKEYKKAIEIFKSFEGKDLKKCNTGYPEKEVNLLEAPYWRAERRED